MELWVAEAELFLDMTDDDIRRSAAELGMPLPQYRAWRDQRIANYRGVNPDDLTPDQHQRLFR